MCRPLPSSTTHPCGCRCDGDQQEQQEQRQQGDGGWRTDMRPRRSCMPACHANKAPLSPPSPAINRPMQTAPPLPTTMSAFLVRAMRCCAVLCCAACGTPAGVATHGRAEVRSALTLTIKLCLLLCAGPEMSCWVDKGTRRCSKNVFLTAKTHWLVYTQSLFTQSGQRAAFLPSACPLSL